MLPTQNPTETAAWKKLEMIFLTLQATHMRELFESDPARFEKYSLTFEEILVDYSKNIVNDEALSLLLQLAQEVGLKEAIESMFRGGKDQPNGRPARAAHRASKPLKRPRSRGWARRDAGGKPGSSADEVI